LGVQLILKGAPGAHQGTKRDPQRRRRLKLAGDGAWMRETKGWVG